MTTQNKANKSNAPNKQLLVRSIVLIFFLSWTFLLGSETWAIQQSCSPMIQPLQQSDVKALGDRCCSEGQKLVDGKCACLGGQELVDGICVSPPPICSEGQKLVDSICVSPSPTCSKGQKLVDGICVSPPIICSEDRKLIGNKCVPIDLIGLGAGGVAAGIAAVTSAPVAVVAGVGIAVWWIVRNLAKGGN